MYDESTGQQLKTLSVKVEMEGKRILTGQLVIPHVKSLNEVLNDAKQFIEFSTSQGTLQYISKKSIVHIESVDELKEPDQLQQNKDYDPFELLGVDEDTDVIDVQHAYHEKAKLYHPDRYLNVDLPSEVLEYIMTMSQRINIAYTEVNRHNHMRSYGGQKKEKQSSMF